MEFTLQRRAMKHAKLIVEKNGSVVVRAPRRVTDREAARFVCENENWIRKQMAEVASRQVRPGTIMLDGKVLDLRYVADMNERVVVADDALVVYGPLEKGTSILDAWWRRRLKAACDLYLDKWYPVVRAHGAAQRPAISIRKMRTRWGSCTPAHATMRINYYLLSAPPECVEYVVLHELTHLLYPDHGPLFKQFLTKFMPDWNKRKCGVEKAGPYIGEF